MDSWLDQDFRDFVEETFADLLLGLARAMGGRLVVLDAGGRVIAPRREVDGARTAAHPEAEWPVRLAVELSGHEAAAQPCPSSDAPRAGHCIGYLAADLSGPGIEELLADLATEIARQFAGERECDREIEAIGALRQEIDLLDRVSRVRGSERDLAAAALGLLSDCRDTLSGTHPVACLALGGRIEWIEPAASDPDHHPGARPRPGRALEAGGAAGGRGGIARAILSDLARPASASKDPMLLHRKIDDPGGSVDGAFTSWLSGDAVIGFVGVLGDDPGGALEANDFAVLRCLAGELAHTAERHQRYREMRDMLFNTIKSLVAAIDAKDEYTRGHSERVHRLALRMGHALGLGAADRQRLSWAALLHDVGKIATPEELLTWRTGLAEDQEQQLRAHVVQGCDLLAPIPQLHSILPAIRHHHERFDGRGYPDGLAGDRIPLHARIIAVAEAFDALTHAPASAALDALTHAPVPEAAGSEAAATEAAALRAIEQDAATRFDPTVVRALRTALAGGVAAGMGSAGEDEDLMLPDFDSESSDGREAA
jgi:putative nucleotidyltransferase with HDIG domain